MGKVFIILAVFRPNVVHLREQLLSVIGQDYENFRLIVMCDGELDESVEAVFSDVRDQRISYRFGDRVGVYRNFLRGLQYALDESESDDDLFAFADQDDIWLPQKLSLQIDCLADPAVRLCHSDAEVVNDEGAQLAPSLFDLEGRPREVSVARLLTQNTVTGMTAVFKKDVAFHCKGAPPQAAMFFLHDLWVALLAGAFGKVRFVPRPLVRYRQHAGNVIGATRVRGPQLLGAIRQWKKCANEFLVRVYLLRHLRRELGVGSAQELQLAAAKRLFGPGFFGLDLVAYALWLLVRGDFGGARHATRLAVGKIIHVATVLKRHGPAKLAGRFREHVWDRAQRLVRGRGISAGQYQSFVEARTVPINWRVDRSLDFPSVNLLVPSLNPGEIFAGIATALDFALAFAKHGYHVRLICTDLPIADHAASRNFVLGRTQQPFRSAVDCVLALVDGRAASEVTIGADDVWIATAWWTAYLCPEQQRPFVYLIQDFEPGFYPWSRNYQNAKESYSKHCVPVFNTTILQNFFTENVRYFGAGAGFAFRPSLHLGLYAPSFGRSMLNRTGRRRVFVYGRPSVPRNMFDLSVEALATWIERRKLSEDSVEIVSIGERHEDIVLPNGITMRSLGKIAWDDYPDMLQTGDIGLSLMLSPHPSHPPLEWAASGIVCVTNAFEGKDLSAYSPNILSAAPTVDGLCAGLDSAWRKSGDFEGRSEGAVIREAALGDTLEGVVESVANELSGGKHDSAH